jgi:hypothetical protein
VEARWKNTKDLLPPRKIRVAHRSLKSGGGLPISEDEAYEKPAGGHARPNTQVKLSHFIHSHRELKIHFTLDLGLSE